MAEGVAGVSSFCRRKLTEGGLSGPELCPTVRESMTTFAESPSAPTASRSELLFQLQLRVARRADELARVGSGSQERDVRIWLQAETDLLCQAFEPGLLRDRLKASPPLPVEEVLVPAGVGASSAGQR